MVPILVGLLVLGAVGVVVLAVVTGGVNERRRK
jgi:hypothetical protein